MLGLKIRNFFPPLKIRKIRVPITSYAFRTNVTYKVKDVKTDDRDRDAFNKWWWLCHIATLTATSVLPCLPSLTSLPPFLFLLRTENPPHAECKRGCAFFFPFLSISLLHFATWWSYTRIWECQWSLFIIYFFFLICFLLYITSFLRSLHQARLFPITITSESSLQSHPSYRYALAWDMKTHLILSLLKSVSSSVCFWPSPRKLCITGKNLCSCLVKRKKWKVGVKSMSWWCCPSLSWRI